MGHGRAHVRQGPGTAARARPGQPAGRCEEADAIAKVPARHKSGAHPHPAGGNSAKLWGGRFTRGLLPELERFSSSLETDFELYPFDIAGSVAHARGLRAAGLLTAPQLTAIERGLRRIRKELDGGDFEFLPSDEDIHTAVERRLTELTPAGAALHTDRGCVAPDRRDRNQSRAARRLGHARLHPSAKSPACDGGPPPAGARRTAASRRDQVSPRVRIGERDAARLGCARGLDASLAARGRGKRAGFQRAHREQHRRGLGPRLRPGP
ncbi:MAG: hypothetical protein E6J53_10735, partial [Chloroflexi bacterium]